MFKGEAKVVEFKKNLKKTTKEVRDNPILAIFHRANNNHFQLQTEQYFSII